MGRGRDLTSNERTIVAMNIKRFWNLEKKQIMHGKVFEIRKLSAQSGVPCSDKNLWYLIRSKRRCLGFEVESSRFSKMVLALTLELILLTVEELQAGGFGDGCVPIILTQPPDSPDVNINDLGLFPSLKYHVSQICTHCTDCTSREEMMMANYVIKAFDEYLADKSEDKWACYYNNLRQHAYSRSGPSS